MAETIPSPTNDGGAFNTLTGTATVSPNYDEPGAASASGSVAPDANPVVILGKAQALSAIGTGLITQDEFGAVYDAMQPLIQAQNKSGILEDGTAALVDLAKVGKITPDTFRRLAPAGTPIPVFSDMVKTGKWHTLDAQIGAVAVPPAASINQSALNLLGSEQFTIPASKAASVCVEYRLRRNVTTAQAAVAALGSAVHFLPDYNRITNDADSNGQYTVTAAGIAFQVGAVAVAAIAASVYEYRYVLKLTDKTTN